MPLVDNPNETIVYDVDRCAGLRRRPDRGAGGRVERRQVTDIAPPPPPHVTEYRIITRTCPCCASATAGAAPEGVAARAQYGPGVLATRRGADLRATTCPSAARPRCWRPWPG